MKEEQREIRRKKVTFLNEKKRKESCSILKVKKRKEMRGEKVEKEKGERERKLSTTPWFGKLQTQLCQNCNDTPPHPNLSSSIGSSLFFHPRDDEAGVGSLSTCSGQVRIESSPRVLSDSEGGIHVYMLLSMSIFKLGKVGLKKLKFLLSGVIVNLYYLN